VSGKKLKRNTLGGKEIRESRLAKVRRARRADRLGRFSSRQLLVRCPRGSVPATTACVETAARPRINFDGALRNCEAAGRRLPSYQELVGYYQSGARPISPGGELTAHIDPASNPVGYNALIVTDVTGTVRQVSLSGASRTPTAARSTRGTSSGEAA
jgi:hypothetical protein